MPLCQDRGPFSVPSLRIFCKRPSTPWAAELWRSKPSNASGLCCFFMSDHPWETTRRPRRSVCPLTVRRWRSRWATGDFSVEDHPGRGQRLPFPLWIKRRSKRWLVRWWRRRKNRHQPVGRQLGAASRATSGKKISRITVLRMLHEAAIKPWQYEHWIFRGILLGLPRRPGRSWTCMRGCGSKSLSTKDYVLCLDEKTSIQARQRSHDEMPPKPKRSRRIESEYERQGAFADPGSMGCTSRDSLGALRGEDGDQAVRPTGGSGFGAGALPRCEVGCFMLWIMVRRIVVKRRGADASR